MFRYNRVQYQDMRLCRLRCDYRCVGGHVREVNICGTFVWESVQMFGNGLRGGIASVAMERVLSSFRNINGALVTVQRPPSRPSQRVATNPSDQLLSEDKQKRLFALLADCGIHHKTGLSEMSSTNCVSHN